MSIQNIEHDEELDRLERNARRRENRLRRQRDETCAKLAVIQSIPHEAGCVEYQDIGQGCTACKIELAILATKETEKS